MKLTKKKAISECKELWAEIEESELSKEDFLKTGEGQNWRDKKYNFDCPLCQFTSHGSEMNECRLCPLVIHYADDCFSLGYEPYEISDPSFFEAIKGLK